MLSKQEEEQERRETLENDLRVLRERGSTFHQHAQSAANDTGGGRFASLGAPHVTGSSAVPIYPAGPQWTADPGSQVVEPPLGVAIDQLEPSTLPCAEETCAPAGAAAAAPAPDSLRSMRATGQSPSKPLSSSLCGAVLHAS